MLKVESLLSKTPLSWTTVFISSRYSPTGSFDDTKISSATASAEAGVRERSNDNNRRNFTANLFRLRRPESRGFNRLNCHYFKSGWQDEFFFYEASRGNTRQCQIAVKIRAFLLKFNIRRNILSTP